MCAKNSILHQLEVEVKHLRLLRRIFQIRPCQRRLASRTPENRLLAPLENPFLGEIEEAPLRDSLGSRVDRRISPRPVDGNAERLPELAVSLRAALRLLETEANKFRPGSFLLVDREFLLDKALGRQAVVVEAHRVKNILPAHPLEPRDKLGLRVAHHMALVKVIGRDIRRRRVDGKDLALAIGGVETEDSFLLPKATPALLIGWLEALGEGGGILFRRGAAARFFLAGEERAEGGEERHREGREDFDKSKRFEQTLS